MFKAYGYYWPDYVDAFVCVWCGLTFDNLFSGEFQKTKEHVIPKSVVTKRRRKSTVSASHYICNNYRGSDVDWVPYYSQGPEMTRRQREWLYGIRRIRGHYDELVP